MDTGDIKKDPFVIDMLKRAPKDVRDTFSEEQLQGLKMVFGTKEWRIHTVDFRGAFRVWRWSYYYVFIAGRNRRPLTARIIKTIKMANGIFLFGFLVVAILLGVLVLYLFKSFLGVDLLPGFSLGIWDWFQQ